MQRLCSGGHGSGVVGARARRHAPQQLAVELSAAPTPVVAAACAAALIASFVVAVVVAGVAIDVAPAVAAVIAAAADAVAPAHKPPTGMTCRSCAPGAATVRVPTLRCSWKPVR